MLVCSFSFISCASRPVLLATDADADFFNPKQMQVFSGILNAEFYFNNHNLKEASKAYSQIVALTQDPEILARATDVFVQARDINRSIQSAAKWVRFAPQNNDAKRLLASLYLYVDRADDALQLLYESVGREESEYLPVFLKFAKQLAQGQTPQTGSLLFQRLIAVNPESAIIRLAEAVFFHHTKQEDLALSSLDQALRLHPLWDPALQLKLKILNDMKRFHAISDWLIPIVDVNSTNTLLTEALGLALLTSGNDKKALTYLEKSWDSGVRSEAIFQALAVAYINQNTPDLAIRILQEGLKRTTLPGVLYYYLGRAEEKLHQFPSAIDYYQKVMATEEKYFDAQIRQALLFAETQKLESSLQILNTLQAKDQTQQLQLWRLQSRVLSLAQKHQQSFDVYTKIIETNVADKSVYYARAMVAQELGQWDVSEQDLLIVIDDNPTNAEALNALGYMLVDHTERYADARVYLEKALKLAPDNYYILDSIGWLHFKEGRFEVARSYLEKALNLNQDAEVAAHLGEVLWTIGEIDQAKQIWRQGQDVDGKNQTLLKTLQRFNILVRSAEKAAGTP